MAGISEYERVSRPTIIVLDSFHKNNTRSEEELANFDYSGIIQDSAVYT